MKRKTLWQKVADALIARFEAHGTVVGERRKKKPKAKRRDVHFSSIKGYPF